MLRQASCKFWFSRQTIDLFDFFFLVIYCQRNKFNCKQAIILIFIFTKCVLLIDIQSLTDFTKFIGHIVW